VSDRGWINVPQRKRFFHLPFAIFDLSSAIDRAFDSGNEK
jgi:hypothetical protein